MHVTERRCDDFGGEGTAIVVGGGVEDPAKLPPESRCGSESTVRGDVFDGQASGLEELLSPAYALAVEPVEGVGARVRIEAPVEGAGLLLET